MNLTPTQEAALETNLGLIEPGICEGCGANGPRFKFYNEYTSEEVVEYDLCPRCIGIALRCVELHLRRFPE